MDAFGRLDVVVNNAGILRDAAFHKMTEEDWSLIQKVHLFGSYSVTQAAWPIMREAGYGRVIMTSSAAGLYGNFGQANYSAAKLGIHGLAQTLAVEGAAKGLQVNTVAPLAASRLTETVMAPHMLASLKPELVTPLVIRLCHESNAVTGELFEIGGGFVAANRWQQSNGAIFDPNDPLSAEMIDAVWSDILDFSDPRSPRTGMDTLSLVAKNIGVDLALTPQ